MSKSKLYTYILISLVVLSLIGCSSFHSQAMINAENFAKQGEKKPDQENWLDAFTLSDSERNEALKTLTVPTTTKDILLRSILLTHESASNEELKEAEQLLKSNFISESSDNEHNKDYQLRNYLLKLNQIFQTHKLELLTQQDKIDAYRRLIKKQKNENSVLENKIEALTDIEHQINLRLEKNPQQVPQ